MNRFRIAFDEFTLHGGYIDNRTMSMEFTPELLGLLHQRMEEQNQRDQIRREELLRESVKRDIERFGESSLEPYMDPPVR